MVVVVLSLPLEVLLLPAVVEVAVVLIYFGPLLLKFVINY